MQHYSTSTNTWPKTAIAHNMNSLIYCSYNPEELFTLHLQELRICSWTALENESYYTVMGHSLWLIVLAQKIAGNSFNHSGWWPFKYPVPERHLLCSAQTATENPRKETKTRVREHIILSSLDSQGLTTNPYAILQKKIAYSFFFFFPYQQCKKHLVNKQVRAIAP